MMATVSVRRANCRATGNPYSGCCLPGWHERIELVAAEESVKGENSHEAAVAAANAQDGVPAPLATNGRSRIELGAIEHRDLEDPVGPEADDERLPAGLEIEDNDAGIGRVVRRRETESKPQIQYSDPLPAHVGHPEQVWRRLRQSRDRLHVENFLHVLDGSGENLFANPKGQVLR